MINSWATPKLEKSILGLQRYKIQLKNSLNSLFKKKKKKKEKRLNFLRQKLAQLKYRKILKLNENLYCIFLSAKYFFYIFLI
jgi:hypothetical protein